MSSTHPPSPLIRHLAWGRMDVEGIGEGKDYKLWPGGGRPWDWRETGTRHVPGIQPADVEELIKNGCKTVVLSRGMLLCLQTCRETLDELETKDVAVHIAETKRAVRIYNELAEKGEAVGGLFHSTC
ncbi:MAG: Mth938-like domain-containing protein [Gammaproteobacteria bacterium]